MTAPADDRASRTDRRLPGSAARERAARLTDRLAWVSVAVFALVSTGSALLGRTTFVATDLLTQFAPWSSYDLGTRTVRNWWPADTVDVVVPKLALLKEEMLSGTMPWWNPYVAGGAPFAALPDTGLLTPLSWPWFFLPDSYAPGAVKLLEIAVAVLGTALFARRLGLSSGAQAVAGLAFVSSGFMIAWTGWPQTRVAALIPLLFWAVDRAIDLRRARDAVPVALVLASMLLAGFPAVAGYAVYAVVLYAVVRLAARRAPAREWVRSIAVGMGGAVLGLGLTAWQLLPFALNAAAEIDFAGRSQETGMHLRWHALATAVVPGVLGDVDDPLWGVSNPVERFSYLGAGAVVLAAVALVHRFRRLPPTLAYALGGVAVCVLLVYGGVALGLVQELPVFSSNFVGRMRVLVGFLVALCAAYGFDAVVRRPDGSTGDAGARRRRWWWAARVATLALTVAGTVAVVRDAMSRAPVEQSAEIRTGTIVAVVLLLGTAAAVAVARVAARRPWAVVVAAVVPLVMAAQALSVVDTWWPRSPVATFYPRTATHDFLAEEIGHDRFTSVGLTMMPGTNSVYRLRSATGHAFHTGAWRDLLEAADPDAMRSSTYSVMHVDALTSPVLDRMGVRYVVVEPGAELTGDVDASSVMTGLAPVDAGGSVQSAPMAAGPRGVRVDLAEGLAPRGAAGDVVVSVLDADGTVLAATRTRAHATTDPQSLWVALPATPQARGPVTLRLELDEGTIPAVAVDAEGRWVANVVRGHDGLVVAHTGDATVYERPTALPRLRWASDAVAVDDPDERVRLLASGRLDPATVVLSDTSEPATTEGRPARVSVTRDDTQAVAVDVVAAGAGYLVVADSRRDGWTVRVDGRPARSVRADHAMTAVHVPAGRHTVDLVFEPPGLRAGAAVSLVSVLGLGLVYAVPALQRRWRRSESVTPPTA